jgi:hypothetical protein
MFHVHEAKDSNKAPLYPEECLVTYHMSKKRFHCLRTAGRAPRKSNEFVSRQLGDNNWLQVCLIFF